MTNREFFTAIINANINAEITDFATDAIRKLDERNSKRKSTQTAAQKANETFKAEIADFLTDKEDFVLCSEIAKHFGVSTQKVTGVLSLMIKDGTVVAADVKVKGGKRKGYKVKTEVEAEVEAD